MIYNDIFKSAKKSTVKSAVFKKCVSLLKPGFPANPGFCLRVSELATYKIVFQKSKKIWHEGLQASGFSSRGCKVAIVFDSWRWYRLNRPDDNEKGVG